MSVGIGCRYTTLDWDDGCVVLHTYVCAYMRMSMICGKEGRYVPWKEKRCRTKINENGKS